MRHRGPRGPLLESACHGQIKCLSNEYQVTAEHNGRSEWNAASLVSGSAYFLLQIRYREGPGHEHLPQRGLQCLTYRTVPLTTTVTHCGHSTLNVCRSESVRCWLQATKTRKLLQLASKNLIIHTRSLISGENTISPLEQVNAIPSDYSLTK
jgi:hypothetical protein